MGEVERQYIDSDQPSLPGVENVAVFTGWPYANGPRHLGHAASLLMGDVMARYYRGKGTNVLMVSGADEFGTPNQIAAEKRGMPPQEYVDEMSQVIRTDFKNLGMSFDFFSRTTTQEHKKVAVDFFSELVSKGYITEGEMKTAYDSITNKSLPDRYVEGVCPHCSYNEARGDQCDSCGTLLDSEELINPRSKITNNQVLFKDSPQLFLRLDLLGDQLKDWIDGQSEWRPNAKNQALGIVGNLKSRSISRDMDWGIPIPQDVLGGRYSDKVLYVWFEAVIGYLSASTEWAKQKGEPDAWKEWWQNPEAKHFYAIGKDNIPFHTIIWPAMLMAHNAGSDSQLHLPDQIVSAEYLTYGTEKFSSSRGNTLYIRDALSAMSPDALRYYLISGGPETNDTEFSLDELVRRNNNELAATWGNLVNRTISFSYRNFGSVPTPTGVLPPEDQQLLEELQKGFEITGKYLDQSRFKAALSNTMALAKNVNRFLDLKAPWKAIKEDRQGAATTMYTALNAVDMLTSMMSPFLPNSSDQILYYLGYDGGIAGEIKEDEVEIDGDSVSALRGNYEASKNFWKPTRLAPGQKLREPSVLYPILNSQQLNEIFNKEA